MPDAMLKAILKEIVMGLQYFNTYSNGKFVLFTSHMVDVAGVQLSRPISLLVKGCREVFSNIKANAEDAMKTLRQ